MTILLAAVQFLKSRWLPLLIVLLAICAGALYLHQRGYQKGVRVTEARMNEERVAALQAQLVELNRVQEIDLKAAVRAAVLEAKVKTHVDSIPIPEFPRIRCPSNEGSANSVDDDALDPDDFVEWLRFFNAAVSDPGPHPAGAYGAAGAAEGG